MIPEHILGVRDLKLTADVILQKAKKSTQLIEPRKTKGANETK